MEATRKTVDRLFRDYYNVLVYTASQILNDMYAAEDIVSDCFEGLWIHHSRYAAADCKNIIFSSVRNRCLSEMKRRGRVQEKHAGYSRLRGPSEEMDRALIEADLIARIYKWMMSLPVKRRKIAELTYFRGMQAQEIAEQLGIDISTVTSQRARVMKALREIL